MKSNIKRLVQLALFCALVTVGTMVITIPIPATQGFINFGDSIIFVASALFGPIGGMLVGGVGSSMADLLLGYPHWALFTFIIKGMEGLVCGFLIHYFVKEERAQRKFSTQLIAFCVGGLVMIGGYFLAGGVMYGFVPALTELWANTIQAGVSVVIALVLVKVLSRINIPFGN
jgi:uncharacterized membrane protein